MDWIELHTSLREHHKTYALAEALGIEHYAAIGIVSSLWMWAFENAGDGDLSRYPFVAVARACYWTKRPDILRDALITSRFLDADMRLHNWDVYAGYAIDRDEREKVQSRERKRKQRATKKEPSRVTDTADDNACHDNVTRNMSQESHASVTRDTDNPVTRDKTQCHAPTVPIPYLNHTVTYTVPTGEGLRPPSPPFTATPAGG